MFGENFTLKQVVGLFVGCCLLLVVGVLIGCDAKVESKPAEQPKDTVVQTGAVTIEHVWFFQNQDGSQGDPTGQYQIRKQANNEVFTVIFCKPTPLFKDGETLYNLKYDTEGGTDCYPFISANK